MDAIAGAVRRWETWLCIALIAVAAILLSYQITRPLLDYDEATYASVVTETLHAGDHATLLLYGLPFFEKPPLYFWADMPIVSLFGPHEWAFRVPAIIEAILCFLCTYLIARELTKSAPAASAAFLALLFAPWFYFFAIEARLDQGVIAAILAVLWVAIKGWRDDRYLWWFFPLMALGFLSKSIIIFLVIPVVLTYCLAYGEWKWLRSKNLWLGLGIAIVILLPWHLWETIRFGGAFWKQYILGNLDRVGSTVTGTNSVGDYVTPLIDSMPFWFWSFSALMAAYVAACVSPQWRKALAWKELAAPLACALFIFAFFSAAQTHLGSYVMPAYPFIALFTAQFAYRALPLGKRGYVIGVLAAAVILSGAYYCLTMPWTDFQNIARFAGDEMHSAQTYVAERSSPAEPLYSLDWQGLNTLDYYSGTSTIYVDDSSKQTTALKPPFYILMTIEYANYLQQNVPQLFDQLNVTYQGKYLILFSSDQPMTVGG